jgi:type IV pilus assembly protein PilV
MRPNRNIRSCRQSGFTLLEVLIAVLVLSIGLLGVAAIQIKALQSAHVSYHRSLATLAAADGVELLWLEIGEVGLNSCPDDAAVQADWINHWQGQGLIPGFEDSSAITDITSYDSSGYPVGGCEYEVRVEWEEARFQGEDVSRLVYAITLPVKRP